MRVYPTPRHKGYKTRTSGSLRVLCALVFLSCVCISGVLSGCAGLSNGKPPGPWHEAYEPISDPAADAFVADALNMAVAAYGEPVIPVNKVMLRRSRRTPEARRYRIDEDFSLTECVDSTNGIFVIYLGVDPGHRNYFALLGHECAHLLNPFIFDWYMEGFSTVFSEEVCDAADREWGDWKRHFERTRREPYGLSYRMMRELKERFPDEYPSIIRHTQAAGKDAGRQHVDVDAWLETLPPERIGRARDIIDAYSEDLLRKTSEQYHFSAPSAVSR